MKVTHEEILKKKLLVRDLMQKYPELTLSPDDIIRQDS
jgi:hypothetical protein